MTDRILVLKHGKIVADIETKLQKDPINYLKKYY